MTTPQASLSVGGDAQIRALARQLLPGDRQVRTPDALALAVRARLDAADPDERRRLRLLLALALADLRRQDDALRAGRDALACKLGALNRHAAAAISYRRVAPMRGDALTPLLRGRV